MFDEINVDFDELSNEGINDIISIVKKQKDTRYQPNVRHKIEDIILITLFAVLAKCNEWTEIASFAIKKEKWLKKYLELPNGIPSHDTIQRVISILNPHTLYSDTINYLINKINSYYVEGVMQIINNEDTYDYEVKVSYKKDDFYKIEFLLPNYFLLKYF